MILIDSHLDLAWNALGWNRDLRMTLPEIRASESGMTERGRQTNTVCFPEMRRGEVAICLSTLLARCHPKGRETNLDYRTREIAYAAAQGQLAYYRALRQDGVCTLIGNRSELKSALQAWETGVAGAPLGFIIAMEGADPILSPDHLDRWWADGLRVIGLAHYGPSAYAHGTGCSGGLTEMGRDLLREMDRRGMILDLTHMADESFWEALKVFQGPVLASHNNCRALVPGDRQFSDDQIKAIIERDGVIGAVFDAWMLVPDWKITKPNTATLQMAVDHMEHVCALAGDTRHIAIGSDLDGGYGTEQTPTDLGSIADLQKLQDLIRARSMSQSDVEAIFHGNWTRFFEKAWA